jgi:Fungalysin metallopeptidase (M36)/CARDB/Fungalysin/Thermolysin Propeptide Motif
MTRTRVVLILIAATVIGLSGPTAARQEPQNQSSPARPDFDVRAERAPAPPSVRALAELARARAATRRGAARLHPYTGALRVLEAPGWSASRTGPAPALRNLLVQRADRLGLDDQDLDSLTVVRDYVSQSTGLRHVTFSQSIDGIPVLGAVVTVHIARNGEVVRITSSAARGADRRQNLLIPADVAAATAAADVSPTTPFVPSRLGGSGGSNVARFARGFFKSDVTASLVWFAMDGGVRLAWHVEVEPEGPSQYYDLVIDAETGALLLRRNRVLDADGAGRVLQSNATQALDPRQPDQSPVTTTACPPPTNHKLRDLTGPYRDPATVLFDTGRLSGNNAHVYRRTTGTEGALGTFDGSRWVFDYPFSSADSAETNLFFSLNFAHDFFYDLGFDEASGNFQVNNFGRGGAGGDPIRGLARAPGRNNATFQPAPEGTSPIISMFLWDGLGCWSQDVDSDGTPDIDGDYDSDILLHEYHHGVSHRLNTNFQGNEADAIGEGGSDFFAYSVNGDTTLAEFSRPGGLRAVNGKTYSDWTCMLGLFCEPHDNGEIWVNVLWDIRQRFRADLVRGSVAAATNESHQLYIDGLKLSPPTPTMLDMRDAMLEADALRNPGTSNSVNFCRLWESFAARGMGLNATDTADNGFNVVGADFNVPAGCTAPPAPVLVSLAVTSATATEVGTTSGVFTISRAEVDVMPLTVNFTLTGSAGHGTDYAMIPTSATIPSGAASVDVIITPINDSAVEANETAVLTLRSGPGYAVGSPAIGTVTIVSEDVAPDLLESAFAGPDSAGAGQTFDVSHTVRNQGSGAAPASTTSFYVSVNSVLESGDPLIGAGTVPELAIGTTHTATASVTLPPGLAAGTYWLIAKADGPGTIAETNEANNNRSDLVRVGPDLVVSAMSAPANAGAGVSMVVSDTTKNNGSNNAPASSTRFYLSLNYALDASDTPLGTRSVGPLAAGASHAWETTLTMPATAPVGTLYLIAKADDSNSVSESLETNNTRTVVVRVGPDLTVSAVAAPARAAAGESITVSDTTKNTGGGPAGASATGFYLSTDYALDALDHHMTATRKVGTLNAGAISSGTAVLTLPAVAPGVWYVIAKADDGAAVGETVETNNTRFDSISIGPDLTVFALTGPSTAAAGSVISVTDTVKNIGADTSAASVTRFYLSSNTLFDTGDTPLAGERPVPVLVVNGVNSGPANVTIPPGLSGTYYLIAVANGYGTAPEASTTNNTRLKAITITP